MSAVMYNSMFYGSQFGRFSKPRITTPSSQYKIQQHSLGPDKMIMVVIIIATDSIINMYNIDKISL